MQIVVTLAFLLVSTVFLTPAMAMDIVAQSRIDAVTIYPQGAEVIRTADVQLEAGDHALIFQTLPGDLQTETLRVEGTADGRIDIGAVDSKLAYAASSGQDAARTRIEKEIETLQDERAGLEQSISDAEFQKQLMQQLANGAVTRPLTSGESKGMTTSELGGLFDLIGGKLAGLGKTVQEARIRQRDIDKQVELLNNRLNETAPKEDATTVVTVHLSVPAATSGAFRLRYRVANAGWQPVYDARLASPTKDQPAGIELVSRADVQQNTSESWANVALMLSTARPIGATAAPDLMPQPVISFEEGRARNFSETTRGGDLLRKPMAAAPTEDAEGNLGNDDSAGVPPAPPVVQMEATAEVAGFQALYAIPGRVTVDNSGTAKKVRIGTMRLATTLSAQTTPKLDPNAYLTARFTLSGETPLLPGVVMLYRDGVYMGQGALPLLSPGEDAKLGFGADDLIKVKRVEVKRTKGEEGLISTSNVDARAYDITVKNLHDITFPVTVIDQLPYSTNENIAVEIASGMTPATEKDVERKRGVLAWKFDLEPKTEKLIKHGYRVTWPQDMKVGVN